MSVVVKSWEWCRDVMRDAMERHGESEIFNTDQDSQFTSSVFIKALKAHDVKISMDGEGRALDNIYIERLWGSLKREKICINSPIGGVDLYRQVSDYVRFYNTERGNKSIAGLHPMKGSVGKLQCVVIISFLVQKLSNKLGIS